MQYVATIYGMINAKVNPIYLVRYVRENIDNLQSLAAKCYDVRNIWPFKQFARKFVRAEIATTLGREW